MHFIYIPEFVGWKEDHILEYLQVNGDEKSFEITIPKSTRLFFSDYNDIAIDYLRAAYVGQQLAGLTDDFTYTKIDPQTDEHISFTIGNVSLDALAEVISKVAAGFGNGEDEDAIAFNEAVATFIDQVVDHTIAPACLYFMDIYNEFIADIFDTDEDGGEDPDEDQ